MNNIENALIEIPLGSKNKYEIDEKTGRIVLDRVLYSAMSYPAEYGIIEETLAPDGDPLDILVIASEPTFPGCTVPARVLGYLSTKDQGKEDYKLISVVDCDPRYDNVQKLEDLSDFVLKEISNFFQNYKVLQGLTVEVGEYHGLEDTLEIIRNVVRQIGEKIDVEREISTMISAKKMELTIMSVIPFAMIGYMRISFPEFLGVLYGNLAGVIIMSVCLVVYLISYEMGKRMVEIEV